MEAQQHHKVPFTKGQKRKRSSYSPSALIRAYQAVKEDGIPVYRAAREYAVPLTTLRDRVDNRVDIDCTKTGPEPVLSQMEEAKLVNHLKELASVGYGYTRTEVLTMATDYAVHIGKRQRDEKCFSMQWFYSFMGRWPELRVVKPSSLSELRARCASETSIRAYFIELENILDKYNKKDKPQLIYNIDEKGINTEYKPPNVIAGRGYQPQTVMAERTKTVTVIGAGNALGNQIPPYFVFPGQRMMPELLKGKTVGADGTMTASGWSNSDVFRSYMKNHFMKYVQGRDQSPTILALYDGHRSHISLDLIDWAKDNNIVLFVLPPHCSHILQPMDVGCFGPFQLKYNQECLAFSRSTHKTVSRYDVCALACKAYVAALSPSNIQSAFSKSGIYPFQKADDMIEILEQKITPSVLYSNDEPEIQSHNDKINNTGKPNEANEKRTSDTVHTEEKKTNNEGNYDEFFVKKGGEIQKKIETYKKKRRNISHVIGGKAVTEDETLGKMKDYLKESTKKVKTSCKSSISARTKTVTTTKQHSKNKPEPKKNRNCITTCSPQPGPSHINLAEAEDTENSSDDESQINENEKCCVCKHFYAKSVNVYKVSIVNWAQCDSCGHWVHLMYCTDVRVVRKNTPFKCPCCL